MGTQSSIVGLQVTLGAAPPRPLTKRDIRLFALAGALFCTGAALTWQLLKPRPRVRHLQTMADLADFVRDPDGYAEFGRALATDLVGVTRVNDGDAEVNRVLRFLDRIRDAFEKEPSDDTLPPEIELVDEAVKVPHTLEGREKIVLFRGALSDRQSERLQCYMLYQKRCVTHFSMLAIEASASRSGSATPEADERRVTFEEGT